MEEEESVNEALELTACSAALDQTCTGGGALDLLLYRNGLAQRLLLDVWCKALLSLR